jgi:hypothetical protein
MSVAGGTLFRRSRVRPLFFEVFSFLMQLGHSRALTHALTRALTLYLFPKNRRREKIILAAAAAVAEKSVRFDDFDKKLDSSRKRRTSFSKGKKT